MSRRTTAAGTPARAARRSSTGRRPWRGSCAGSTPITRSPSAWPTIATSGWRPPGRSFAGIVDFVSFHCYDAGGLRTQIDALTARTGKPVLLEEMGWPTGPDKLSSSKAVYDEPTQSFLYHTMLDDAKASTLAGVIEWQLEDLPIGTLQHYIKPSIEAWFGLVRRDGSLKPAAALFRDLYPAPPLPSSTVSNLPRSCAAELGRRPCLAA